MFVLFEELGRRYLETQKGYSLPPWCQDGCSFLIELEENIQPIIEQALWDKPKIESVIASFRLRFGNRNPEGPSISQNISQMILNKIKNSYPATV